MTAPLHSDALYDAKADVSPDYSPLLEPLRINKLVLRNRIISTAHVPRLTEDSMPGEAYRLYHTEKAKGGLALTIFGGSSAVAQDSPTSFGQIPFHDDRVIPHLKRLSSSVKAEGAAIMVQLAHAGRRAGWRTPDGLTLIAPSETREPVHRSFAREMEEEDFSRVRLAFADAARRAREGGLDGIEILVAAHQLLDSFLTPAINRRTDAYGGSIENRMRFPLEVLEAIRERVGQDFIVGLRLSGDERQAGGLRPAECLEIAERFAASGLVNFLSVYQGTGDTLPALSAMLPDMTFPEAPFLHLASAVRARVSVPVFHASAIRRLDTAARSVAEGHVDAVAMTRAHIADPHIVSKLKARRLDDIRPCVGANYCVDFGGHSGVCLHNAATGRERVLPHILSPAEQPKRVVIVGGGPAGLEAARCACERGHRIVLFEASDELGGQLRLAARAPGRERLAGIAHWLELQVRKGGARLELGRNADASDIMAETPDAVIIATGGVARKPEIEGTEFCETAWGAISAPVSAGESVLLADETGLPAGAGCADMLARAGANVELASPDRMPAEEVGQTLHVAYLRSLYTHGVTMTPNVSLSRVTRDGNRLCAELTNTYTGMDEIRVVDRVIVESGTLSRTGPFEDLRHSSRNLGQIRPGPPHNGSAPIPNPEGSYTLHRIGDALVGRNVHAAIHDAAKLVNAL